MSLENVEWTMGVLKALMRANEDPDVAEAIQELGPGHLETGLHVISGMQDEDAAFRKLKGYYLGERERKRAAAMDLGPKNFSDAELQLLGINAKGRDLMERMRSGDESVLEEASVLLEEIRKHRRELGLE